MGFIISSFLFVDVDEEFIVIEMVEYLPLDSFLFHLILEEMEMKIESANTSPVNNSTSTIDTQGDGQKIVQRATSRIQSSQTMLTDVVN